MQIFGRKFFSVASIWFAGLAALTFGGAVQASVITTGPTPAPPDIFTFTCPGVTCPTILAITTTNWTNTPGTMSGTLTAAVFSDPANTFGVGDFDFMYQVSNSASSTVSIGRVTAINFTGFQTDVGYTATGLTLGGPFTNGTIAPELVDRSSADTIGFSFNAPLLHLIAPGETSTVLIIETNATSFATNGFANIIDGGVTTVPAYEPPGQTPPTPEPASFLLAGAGLFALWQVRRFKKLR